MAKLLLFFFLVLPLGAQEDPAARYIGSWSGTARVKGKGSYKVNAVISRQGENLRISHASRGGPGNSAHSGVVMAVPKGDGRCYTANIAPRNSPIPMNADLCFDDSGNLRLVSPMAKGSAVMSATGRSCNFNVSSPMGSASGVVKKQAPKKRARKVAA